MHWDYLKWAMFTFCMTVYSDFTQNKHFYEQIIQNSLWLSKVNTSSNKNYTDRVHDILDLLLMCCSSSYVVRRNQETRGLPFYTCCHTFFEFFVTSFTELMNKATPEMWICQFLDWSATGPPTVDLWLQGKPDKYFIMFNSISLSKRYCVLWCNFHRMLKEATTVWMDKLPPGVDGKEKHWGLNRNALILVCPHS